MTDKMTAAATEPVKPLVAVTGSRAPYIYDLPQLLSLPDGFEFRFRYFPVWVADELTSKLQSYRAERDLQLRQKVFAGEPLVLLFHSQELKRLLPLRLCTIISLEGVGPLVFLRFRLGPLAHVSEDVIAADPPEVARASESDRLNRDAVSWLGLGAHDLSTPLPKGMYLRRAAAAPPPVYWVSIRATDTETDAAAWAAMAALLQGEPQLKRIPLFKLIGFQRKDGSYRKPVEIKRTFTVSPENTKGFKLTEGERYRLRVLEWCETIRGGDPGAAVSATVPAGLVSLEGSSNLVVGKYDVLEFTCMARKPGYGELAIRVAAPSQPRPGTRASPTAKGARAQSGRRDTGGDSPASAVMEPEEMSRQKPSAISPNGEPWPYIYAARLPIHVTHNWRRLLVLLSVGALGIVLYVWSPDIPLLVSGLRVPRQVVQLVGLVMMFVALGEYLERFVKFSGDVKDFPLSPLPPGGRRTP